MVWGQVPYFQENIDEFDIQLSSEYLDNIISSYQELYPDINEEIKNEVAEKGDQHVLELYKKVICSE